MTMKSIPTAELQSAILNCGGNEESTIDIKSVQNVLNKISSKLNINLIAKNQIGYEIATDLEATGYTSLKKLIQWNYSVTSLFSVIKGLLDNFPNVIISEYWGSTFQLKISKQEGVTIGFLFGYLDSLKGLLNEYSISQTSLEQIFNDFAGQDEYDNPAANQVQSHKPVITIDRAFLQSNFN